MKQKNPNIEQAVYFSYQKKNKTENEFSPWLRAKGSYKAVMRHLQDTCNLLTIYTEFLPKDKVEIKPDNCIMQWYQLVWIIASLKNQQNQSKCS